ncbi:MAG: hypothetical protein IPO08_23320 [Xanthomonadales bacterium]|nr:hypothetical protein [Xanthomonadales bacterium]
MLPIIPNAEPTDFHCAKLEARKHSIDTGAMVGLWALTQPTPRLLSIFTSGTEFVPGDSQPILAE